MKNFNWIRNSFILAILFSHQVLFAQQIKIEGKVFDPQGKPVSGVTIQVIGQKTSTLTNQAGTFRLSELPIGTKLIIRSVGYEPQEIIISNSEELNITLNPTENVLEEAVAVGYGTVKKKDLTGSVTSISAETIQEFPNTTIAQAMQGRAAGVQVQQSSGLPGSGIQIRIRGTNSVRGDNEPLWIIDGFPGNSNLLNPSDIESIEVLKDASATAIYGSRGANGVVIVTTRKGKAGTTRIEYNGNYSIQKVIKKLDLLNAQEYMRMSNIQQLNDNGKVFFTEEDIAQTTNYDWQDLTMRSAPLHDHNITVLGGNDKTKFSLGTALFDQKGIIKGNEFQRINVRGTIDHKVNDKVSVFMNTLLNKSHNYNSYSSSGLRGNSLLAAIPGAPPTVGPYDDNGNYRLLNATYPFISDAILNPIRYINEVSNKWVANRVILNAGVKYSPLKDLNINVGGNMTNVDARTDNYTSTMYQGSVGEASIAFGNSTEYNFSATADYTKRINEKHQLTAMIGTTSDISISRPVSLSGSGFLSDIYGTDNIGSASLINTPSSNYSKWTMLSYLGRINYNFNDRLLFTGSIRADGSSRYSEGNKWGYFPSAALAYRLSEEQFVKALDVISDLKFRLGYGETGSTAIDPYYTLNMLAGSKVVFNDNLFNTFAPGTRLPAGLKWETTAQSNFGLDLGLFSDKIKVTADYYIKKTKDLLNAVQLPRSLGYTTTVQNIGEVENRGFEFMVDANVIDRDFKWNVAANFSINRNKVVKLYNGQDILGSALNITIMNDNLNLIREGQPMSIFYGYVEDGYTDDGKINYKDLDGSGTITSTDKTYIGNPNPKFTYGFNSNMSYKNFDLSFFIQGTQGNDLFSMSVAAQTMDFGQGLNSLREVYESNWTPENVNAAYPKISRNTTTLMSDRYVYDGSYLRLKNIQLPYTVPVDRINLKGIKGLQVFVSGQNLLTLSNYPWFDPDINTKGGGSSLNQGIDHYAYPVAKSYSFGVKLGM